MTPDRHPELGTSLVEVLVMLALFSVAGLIATSAIVGGLRAGRTAEAEFDRLSDLKQSVERIARELRAADPLVPDPSYQFTQRLGAVVYRDGERREYTYYVADGALKQDLEVYADPDATTPSSTTTGVLIRELDDPSRPVFRYQNGKSKWAAHDTDGDGYIDDDCSAYSDPDERDFCEDAYAKSDLVEIRLQEGPTEVTTKVAVRRVVIAP